MIFRPKGENERRPTIHINGLNVLKVDNVQLLGKAIYSELNFHFHFHYFQFSKLYSTLHFALCSYSIHSIYELAISHNVGNLSLHLCRLCQSYHIAAHIFTVAMYDMWCACIIELFAPLTCHNNYFSLSSLSLPWHWKWHYCVVTYHWIVYIVHEVILLLFQ